MKSNILGFMSPLLTALMVIQGVFNVVPTNASCYLKNGVFD